MELEARVIQVLPLQEGVSKAGRAWKKAEYLVETIGSQYPKQVKLTVFGDKADTLRMELGKSYAIGIDLESREYQGRYYTDVNVWSVRELTPGVPTSGPNEAPFPTQPQASAAAQSVPPFNNDPFGSPANIPAADSSDDLPF